MPFRQAWYLKDHIVKVDMYGDVTEQEIAEALVVSRQYLLESPAQRIHFIHDWSQIDRYPTNLRTIHESSNFVPSAMMSKLGWVVIYGTEQKLLRFIGDLTFQLFQIRTHMSDDLESALTFLTRQDPTLQLVLKSRLNTDVTWYLPGHILYCYDVIKADDMMLRNQNALKLLEKEGKPPFVHMLIDFSSTDDESYHVSVRNLVQRAKHSPEFEAARDNLIQHPLFGWVVVFGIHNVNLNVGGKINAMRTNYKRKEVDTLEEALQYLKQIDPNVKQLLESQPDQES